MGSAVETRQLPFSACCTCLEKIVSIWKAVFWSSLQESALALEVVVALLFRIGLLFRNVQVEFTWSSWQIRIQVSLVDSRTVAEFRVPVLWSTKCVKTIRGRWKNILFLSLINDCILSWMLKSFKSKAAAVRDDTPERAFQSWIGRRREWGFKEKKINKNELTSVLLAVLFFPFEVSVGGFDKCQKHSFSQIRFFLHNLVLCCFFLPSKDYLVFSLVSNWTSAQEMKWIWHPNVF